MGSLQSDTGKLGREHSELITSEGKLSFRYGDQRIHFLRTPSKGNSRKVTVKVLPDRFVEVAAPESMENQELVKVVRSRGRWISDQLVANEHVQQDSNANEESYVSGSSHRYLGRSYLLKVVENQQAKESVRLYRGRFEVLVNSKDAFRVRAVLRRWYEQKAKEVFERRLTECLKKTFWVERRPFVKLLWMKKQWGNCSPEGNLSLNVQLVKASKACIDYVIFHELCHIAVGDHSEAFYKLLLQVLPNWNELKVRLDSSVHTHENLY